MRKYIIQSLARPTLEDTLVGVSPRDMVASTVPLLKAFIHVRIFECVHPPKEMEWKWPNKGEKRRCKGDSRSLVTIAHGLVGKNIIMKAEVNNSFVDTPTEKDYLAPTLMRIHANWWYMQKKVSKYLISSGWR